MADRLSSGIDFARIQLRMSRLASTYQRPVDGTREGHGQQHTPEAPKSRLQSHEVVVSPSRSLRLSQQPGSSPPPPLPPLQGRSRDWRGTELPHLGNSEVGASEVGASEIRDAIGDESESVDKGIDEGMAALDNYLDSEGENESRQARIEAEYNAQKGRVKGHWCRKYSSVVLLSTKVR
ncbi:hypothetical protein BJ508DRAFT_314956 [Ascobolus immersus RN42]|uniref:Uncharacterized protein n=1 Tax=Ascobolus immersus RN42 TaxID=1160509 RepID=A0A3N4HCY3_ASCIM|nr:hypothetical protein BJ508DRAFT_314956 [Ascobolus immersus RN42]